MSNIIASRVMSSGLLALLVTGAAVSTVACSNAEPEPARSQTWSCATAQVPMGEAVRCTTSAVSIPVEPSSQPTESTPSTTYDCNSAEAAQLGLDCPPLDASIPAESPSDSTTGSTNANDVSSDGATSHAPTECGYVPDLDYCAPGSSDAATSGGGTSSSGSADCGKTNCSAPGQEKKGSSDGATSGGGASSSGASGSSDGGAKGKGKHWKCTKDASGDKTCTSTPDCAPGTHAAACGACVSDSDGATEDCVPPSEGGCWVTGGGFIEGPSIVPAGPADGHDNFGGNAKPMKNGTVSGHWNHVDHGTGNHAKGRPEYIVCRHVDEPGPGQPGGKKGLTANQVYFGGHAQWRSGDTWADGYWFDVVAKDHGEPGSAAATKKGGVPDAYHFTVRKIDDPALGASGKVVYETRGSLVGGNIQMHPSNNGHPATTSPLPAWVALEP